MSGIFFSPIPSDNGNVSLNLKNCMFLREYKRFSILYMQPLAVDRALLSSSLARSRQCEDQVGSGSDRNQTLKQEPEQIYKYTYNKHFEGSCELLSVTLILMLTSC